MTEKLDEILINTSEEELNDLIAEGLKSLETFSPDYFDHDLINETVETLLDNFLTEKTIDSENLEIKGRIWRRLFLKYLDNLHKSLIILWMCQRRKFPFKEKESLYQYASELTVRDFNIPLYPDEKL